MHATPSVRLHQLLLAVVVLVPAFVFSGAAWWSYKDVLRESEDVIIRTGAVMHEHARKVFDTVDLALARVDDRARSLTWDEIASPVTSAFLRDLKAPLEQAVSIWITDANGHVRAGSQEWDPRVSIARREFFKVQREADAGTFISAPFSGRATATASFAVSRRRTSPDGSFDGTIHIALSPQYFARFFEEAAPPVAYAAALLRSDGEVLARAPYRSDNLRLPSESALMQRISEQPDGGFFMGMSSTDGTERFYAYRKVAAYPLYVAFGLDRSTVLARWRNNLVMYGLVAALSAVTLLLVSWLALQRARAEQAAVARLRSETEQRVKAEERLRQAQKMESLGQLTGGIAHDFNNLLAVILGNLDLVRKRLTAADPRVKRLLDSAIQGAERGAALTQRLLAFARRQDLTPQVVEVPRLVAEMKELLNRSLGPAIRISIGFPPDLPPVRIDPNQFELALLNLAVNARDAMPLGGTITLSARVETVKPASASGLAPGRYVCVSLADTGVGMDAATLAQAVEPFFTTKGVGKGTGLGLSMIHGFAVQSGGTLKLASKPGVGTSAELWLPEGERLAAAVPAQQPAQASQRTCKVLLVDDDSLVLTGTAAMLEDLGHVVVEAASGEDALNALDANAGIDLVITDYAMPGMNGLELTDRIRERLPELPVLLATGQAELPERVQLNLVRINKPFRQEDLANAIAEIVTPSCEPTNLVHFPRRHAGE